MSRAYRITKVLLMGYHIRAWEHADTQLTPGPNHEITVGLRAAITGTPGNFRVTPDAIRNLLRNVPGVARFEIVDAMGNGIEVALNE